MTCANPTNAANTITRAQRATLLQQQPHVFWLTGLSGAGKSTIARCCEEQLHASGKLTFVLDGDALRSGLNSDLGFSATDRATSVRRAAEVARMLADAGCIVFVALISPFRADRAQARQVIGSDAFTEVFVDIPLTIAEARDPKGLYRRAREGRLPAFTGIDSPYEIPLKPDVHLLSDSMTPDDAANYLVRYLADREAIAPILR